MFLAQKIKMIYFPLFIFEPVATNPTGQWVIPVDATGQNGVNGSFCIRLSTSTIDDQSLSADVGGLAAGPPRTRVCCVSRCVCRLAMCRCTAPNDWYFSAAIKASVLSERTRMFYPATAKLTEVRAWTKLWEGSGRGGMERERRHDNDDGKGHRPSTRRIGRRDHSQARCFEQHRQIGH